MDMATTTDRKDDAMITVNLKGREYQINTDWCVESNIYYSYEITGKRGASGALLVYKPQAFGTCARVLFISELERMSDFDMTVAISEQTDLIALAASEEVAA
jgi:hypothetical protein